MATTCFAMWLQDVNLGDTNHLMMIFVGLVAFAMVVMAVALIAIAVTTGKAVKGMHETVGDLRDKVLPLIEVAMDIGKSSQAVLHDAAPKVKQITDNLAKASDTLAETSAAARAAVQRCDATIADVNMRTQRQVARVDGMVTATLTSVVEVTETIAQGIRGPAQKIAAMAGQAKHVLEGLLAKVRGASSAKASGGGNRPGDC